METSLLEKLIRAHATPGDENEVFEILLAAWQGAGLATTRLGSRAVVADADPDSDKPVLLITAHADCVGFAVDRLPGFLSKKFGLTTLGSIDADELKFPLPAVLKTRGGLVAGNLKCDHVENVECVDDDDDDDDGDDDADWFFVPSVASPGVCHGDRVAFAPKFSRRGQKIYAPFLDNRIGCWLLALIAPEISKWDSPWRVMLAATSSEEMNGHGAAVLAHAIRPDAVIILDTTYESKEQRVKLGGGPVLTLSDKSVLLPLAARDHLLKIFHEANLPLQTEVYNFSGTDAKAFPFAGLPGLVMPLLIPTRGNHSPRETADLRDVEVLLKGLRLIVKMPM